MISTRRGLEALVAIAVLLAVLLVLDLRREDAPVDRSLAQGLDVETVTALMWVRKDAADLHLVREGERWVWIKPVEAIADRGAVANVLATLRAARWHRREPATAAGPTHTVLTISTVMPTTGGRPPEYADLPRRTLAIGSQLAGTEQAWIVDGEHALLVDAWVARALDPDPVSLMVRRPLESIAQAAWIEITDPGGVLRLEGTPRRLVAPYIVLVKASLAEELHHALAAFEVSSLPIGSPASVGARDALKIATPAGTVTFTQGCGADPKRVLVSSPAGTGCVDQASHLVALHGIAALRQTGREVVEPRPAPLDAATITLRDGEILDVSKLRVGEHAADPVPITELLSVLSAPAVLVVDAPLDATTLATLAVTDRQGSTIALELLGGGLVRRPGEALAMKLAPGAVAILERPGSAYRDLVPWVEDPLAISAIRISRGPGGGPPFSSVRGNVVGEWSNPAASRALEALAAQLAAPRPLAPGPATFATVHRVTIVVKPPAGDAIERVLELGRKTAAGCPARANGVALLLPSAVCDGVAALVGR